MENQVAQNILPGGVFALLAVKIIWDWLSSRRNNPNGDIRDIKESLRTICQKQKLAKEDHRDDRGHLEAISKETAKTNVLLEQVLAEMRIQRTTFRKP